MPKSSGYSSGFSSASTLGSARVYKTRPSSIHNLNGSISRDNHAMEMRRKTEKIQRAEDGKKALAKAVLPAKLATFLGIFALVSEVLRIHGEVSTAVKSAEHSVEDLMAIFYRDVWLLLGTSAGILLPWVGICTSRPTKCGLIWLLTLHFITLLVNIGNVAVWMWILWNVLSNVYEEEENELNEAIFGFIFSVIIILALVITVVKILKELKRQKKAVADPVRLEMDILREQLEEIQDKKLETSRVEDIGGNFGLAEKIWQRDAANFYRGYVARSSMDIPSIDGRLSTQPHRGKVSRSPQPRKKSIKWDIPSSLTPIHGRKKIVHAREVQAGDESGKPGTSRGKRVRAHSGGRSKKKEEPSLNDAMLKEHSSEIVSLSDGSKKIECKKPTPAPRHHKTFRVEAMIHHSTDANL